MEQQYEIGISPDESYVYARAFLQPITLKLALKVAQELIPLIEKIGSARCLLDLRGTRSGSSTLDKYQFAYDKAEAAGVPRHMRAALLKDVGDNSLDFLAIVMKNAGYNFQMFENEREAIEWLKDAQSSQ